MRSGSFSVVQSKRKLILAAAATVVFAGSFASGATYTWIGPNGGDYNSTTNWSTGTVPTPVDVGIFSDSATSTVNFSAAANPFYLGFANTAGAYTFNLNGASLALGGTGASGGGMTLGFAAGQVNDVTFTGGSVAHAGTNGNVFVIGGATGSNGNTLRLTSPAMVMNSPSVSTVIVLGSAGSNDNTFKVDGGASFIMRGNMNIGAIGASASTGNLLDVNGATFTLTGGNRGIACINGQINLTNSYSDMGFFRLNAAGNNTTLNFNSGTLYARNLQIDNGRDLLIGDGGATPAVFGPAYSNGTVTVGGSTASKDMILNSNGQIVGTGSIMLNSAGGTLRGNAGAIIAPSVIGQPTLTSDNRAVGTLQLAGNYDNHNITMNFDMAGAIGIGTISGDKLQINGGNYAHGGTINFDMTTYFPPPDANYEMKAVGFSTTSGATTDTAINFLNGGPLAYEWRSDGLYLLLPRVAANSTWNFNGSGDWSGTTNWARFVPNGIDTTANFGTIITGPATVNMDIAITAGHINFTSPISYTINNANALTLDVSAGSATIGATAGSHAIQAAISLSDDLGVDIAVGASVDASGGISGAAGTYTLTKAGAGRLDVAKLVVSGVNVTGGTLGLDPNGTNAGAAEVQSIAVSGGGNFDVTNNAVIVDYDATDPTSSIRALLASGYAGGSWNGSGINSGTAAATPGTSVGYARSSEVSPGPIFGSPDATAVLVRYTRAGDANLDGTTNISDFSSLASNFNVVGDWVDGDFNYDGTVNIGDFSILASNFNQGVAGARGAVPEPAMCVILAAVPAIARRRRD